MAGKRVFGKARLTGEEREAERRIREATKDQPSLEELKRRLGPFEGFETLEDLEAARFRAAIAHKIGVAREDAGLTQAGLAKLVGTDQANISRLENGARNITVDTLARVAKAVKLKVTVGPAKKKRKTSKKTKARKTAKKKTGRKTRKKTRKRRATAGARG